MKKAAIFFAEGFEEIEALTVVDMLRRAKIQIDMVSITGEKQVESSHRVIVMTDKLIEDCAVMDYDMLVLPGGMPGTIHLGECGELMDALKEFDKEGKPLAAICAAPSLLGKLEILDGRKATCYPGFEDQLLGAELVEEKAVTDGNVITGRGMGAAIEFAAAIITCLENAEKAEEIKNSICYKFPL